MKPVLKNTGSYNFILLFGTKQKSQYTQVQSFFFLLKFFFLFVMQLNLNNSFVIKSSFYLEIYWCGKIANCFLLKSLILLFFNSLL